MQRSKAIHILLIEDDRKVAQAVREGLEAEHYTVTVAATGEEGFFLATTQTFDLVLLDLMLPGRDGIDILTALRGQQCQTPVLILSARKEVEQCLSLVIDFYERTEPSSPIPLLARRIRRLVPMDFMQIMEEIAPSGMKEFRNIAGVDDKSK